MNKKLFVIITMIAGVFIMAKAHYEEKEKGIKVIKTFEQNFAQGEKSLLIEKEEYFNEKGVLIEEKNFDEKGKITDWDKYIYNANGDLTEEQKLNSKGDIIKRIEFRIEDGVVSEKLYYDEKGRLYKKKRFEYGFF